MWKLLYMSWQRHQWCLAPPMTLLGHGGPFLHLPLWRHAILLPPCTARPISTPWSNSKYKSMQVVQNHPVYFILYFKAPQQQPTHRNEQKPPPHPPRCKELMRKCKNATGIVRMRFSTSWRYRQWSGAIMHLISMPGSSIGLPGKF